MAEQITISAPLGKKAEFEEFARKKGMKLSPFMVKACEEYIEKNGTNNTRED